MAQLFRTGHDINMTVCEALRQGFAGMPICATYGILRGGAAWVRQREKAGQRVLLADKGYWKPGHFEGYYRLSFTGTQARYVHGQAEDRWSALRLPTEPWQPDRDNVLICPPTQPVADFYGLKKADMAWGTQREKEILLAHHGRFTTRVREKGCERPLDVDLAWAGHVVTFNSSVGWEALRRGIPVVSDVEHSTVGSFLGTTIAELGQDMRHIDRRALFCFMANRQFTLAEIKNGTARSYLL